MKRFLRFSFANVIFEGAFMTPKVLLAPMAGVTDFAFRRICREFGAEMTYTEMVSAKALSFNDKKTKTLLVTDETERPRGVQIFGSDPDIMAQAAKELSDDFDVIDINMGCPAPKITGNGEGSALLKNLPLAAEIIKTVSSECKKPVTVKIRRGFKENEDVSVRAAELAEKNGAAAITVHGRFTEQMFSGKNSLETIKNVKKAVSVPVIGNGDIFCAQDALKMFEETGCDAVMVGRGAMGNPFIFREIACLLRGEEYAPATDEEKIDAARRNVRDIVALKGEHIGILESRKIVSWFVKGMRGATEVKREANAAKTLDEMMSILDGILKK